MKKILIACLMLAAFPLFAQKISDSKVPVPVKRTFSGNFAGVTDVKWEQEKGNYEANFKQNNQKKSATFAPDGTWLETEQPIEIHELPVAASDYLAKHYKGEKIKEAAKITLANGDTHYEAEVKGMDIIFDEKGKFIKTQKD